MGKVTLSREEIEVIDQALRLKVTTIMMKMDAIDENGKFKPSDQVDLIGNEDVLIMALFHKAIGDKLTKALDQNEVEVLINSL